MVATYVFPFHSWKAGHYFYNLFFSKVLYFDNLYALKYLICSMGEGACLSCLEGFTTPQNSRRNWTSKFQVLAKAMHHTYIVMMGATASRFATKIPISAMATVKNRARVGSPFFDATENRLRKGMRLSRDIA